MNNTLDPRRRTLADRLRRRRGARPLKVAELPVTTAAFAARGPKLPPYTGD